jgi:hypothetical protein
MEKYCYNHKLTGPVAQLVEQRIENPRVGSSILPQATISRRPTVLSWAFSFWRPPDGAAFGAILRVPRTSFIRAGNAHKSHTPLSLLTKLLRTLTKWHTQNAFYGNDLCVCRIRRFCVRPAEANHVVCVLSHTTL